MNKTMAEKKRAFETTLEIDAPPDAVWKALTEAEELMRWFPLRAEVKPGKGGSVLWAWEEHWDWPSRIDAWEPGRLLRLVQDDYRPNESVERSTVVMEFRLETHAGKTRLHFVHSGFGQGDAWDHEIDSISEGWPFELRSLRLYLERYRGLARTVGRATASVAAPRSEVWAKLIGTDGFQLTPVEPREGGPFGVVSPTGERLTGTVEMVLPGRSVAGIVKEMDRTLLRVATWSQPDGKSGAWLWLASYGGEEGRIRAFEKAADAMLKRLFPSQAV